MPRGRPQGQPKTGGRRKGATNKIDTKHREEIIKLGITPLEYMIDILNDPDPNRPIEDRKWAAQQAAPYVHSRLSSIDHSGRVALDLSRATDDELKQLRDLIAKLTNDSADRRGISPPTQYP